MNSLATPVFHAPVVEARAIHVKYRPDIDGLRAVAVLAVLAFHAFPRYLPGGFVGVDVFFVISGFLITKVILTTLEDGSFSVLGFYIRRVLRIFPALIVVLLACLAFGWKTMLAEDLIQLAKHILGGASFSSNLLLWQEAGYFDAASEAKPLLHLWSLGIEEQFYIAWPLLIWWAWRRSVAPGVLIGVTALASFLVNAIGVVGHPTATFYSPLSRAWELLLGAGLAYAGPAALGRAGPLQRSAWSMVGFGMILFAAFFLDSKRSFPGWWALLPSVGACLVIAAAPGAWVNRLILARPMMVGIGLVSYPLYLWHWPVLTLGRSMVPDGDLGRVGLLLLSSALAWGTFALVEKPLRHGRFVGRKAIALSLSMLAMGGAAAVVFKGAGFPSRYPDIIQAATKYDLDGFRAGIRWRRCFMEFNQDGPQFGPECVEPGSAPMMMLWGDSGAAALYPGFRALADRSREFRMAQFTSSACPPILAFESAQRPACKANNLATFEMARSLVPDVVVLNAIWQYYDATQVAATIEALRKIGIRRIVLLGPSPVWDDAPARIVLKLWQGDPWHRVPSARLGANRLAQHDVVGRLEANLRGIALAAGADYVSLMDAMCDGTGCLMRASSESGDSFYLDAAHFNSRGAEFVVNAIASQLKVERPPASK